MALALTPLEALPPAVDKVAGPKAPAALKLMAARGLSPLKPHEQCIALYQLHLSDDEALKQAALKSSNELPEHILRGALAEPLDGRVLDFFARRVWQKPATLEVVLLNRATDDETYRHLASVCRDSDLELIARNEERLLRCPAIITALYLNPKTRQSTAQRAIELAVRNNVEVEGLPAFEEIKHALLDSTAVDASADEDAAFQRAAEVAVDAGAGLIVGAVDEEEAERLAAEEAAIAEALAEGNVPPESKAEADEKKQRLEELSPAAQIRIATLGNSFARAVLIRSKNRQVALACIKSPAIKDSEVVHYANNRSLDEDIIRYIARRRSWTRHYPVKVALCNNPKCPIPVSMSFLAHLRPPELKNVGRSKNISSALATAARQLLSQRSG